MPLGPRLTVTTDQVLKIQEAFRAALLNEGATAQRHQADIHFTTSRGRNLAEDEYLALHYALRLSLAPAESEVGDPEQYLLRLMRELEVQKDDFRRNEEDPEGFGIATLHGLSRVLEQFRQVGD
jgi:hypothetical protein